MTEALLPRAVELTERFIAAIDDGLRADRLLAKILRENPTLTSEERRLVAAWTLGICIWRGRLDAMAQGDRALWLPLFLLDREGRHLRTVAESLQVEAKRLSDALSFRPSADLAEQLAFRRSLPLWLAQRWTEQFGSDRAEAIAAAMNERGPIAVRAHVPIEELERRLNAEGVESRRSALTPHALLLSGRPNISALNAWKQGLFEVQDEGSQLIAEAVEAKPGQHILELCAGSGGKTIALASAMRNEGRLVAIDIDGQRLQDLTVRLKRHRISCVETVGGDATVEANICLPFASADAVLVDAPCSASGTLRRSPDARWRLSPTDFERWATVQRALLKTAENYVKPGGCLVYATCSIDRTENEEVAASVDLDRYTLVSQRQTSPDVDGCDGFYQAVWRRLP